MSQAKLNPLTWNVPIVDSGGRPTPEFQRKWLQQTSINTTITDFSNAAAVSAVLDQIAEVAGQILIRGTAVWAGQTMSGDATLSNAGVLTVGAAKVTLAKIANAASSSRLLGSGASGAGATYSEIVLGSGLAMTGTTLSASGSGGGSANLSTEYTNTTPTAPATGVTLFSRKRANFNRPAYIGTAGPWEEIQEFLATTEAQFIYPQNNGTALSSFGITPTTSGLTARGPGTTSDFVSMKRIGLTNTSGTNAFAQLRSGVATAARGSAATRNGFYSVIRFGVLTTIANGRIQMGFASAGVFGASNPSALTDCFFIGKDDTDTNLQVMQNDNAGTCTKTDLGASFPANTSGLDAYEARLYCPPAGTTMYYYVKNLLSGAEVDGSVTTNLPTAATLMFWAAAAGTGATSGVHAVDVMSMYMVQSFI